MLLFGNMATRIKTGSVLPNRRPVARLGRDSSRQGGNAMSTSAPVRANTGPLDDPERARQMREAEELLFTGPKRDGFAKALFRGEFRSASLFPYPALPERERARVDTAVEEVRNFADAHIDAAAIDRNADIPREVIDGLAKLGVLGMTAPVSFGGLGFSQSGYCRIMEVIGGHCSSTAAPVHRTSVCLLLPQWPSQVARPGPLSSSASHSLCTYPWPPKASHGRRN